MFAGKRVLAVVNPTSGARKGGELEELVSDALVRFGAVDPDVRLTEGPDDAMAWGRAAGEEGFELVLACGGDGTVTDVTEGVFRSGSGLTVAVLPLGTGNGLARVLGIPLDPEAALETLAKGKPVDLDVLDVTSHDSISLLFCGAGIDAEINEEADREAKDQLGFLAYVKAAFDAARDAEDHQLVVEIDGDRTEMTGHTVIAFNATRLRVLGIELGPDAEPHDGKMEVAIMRSPEAVGVIRNALRLLDRRASRQELIPATRLRVEANPPLPVQVDGDPIGETPLEVVIVPAGATFVAPTDYAED